MEHNEVPHLVALVDPCPPLHPQVPVITTYGKLHVRLYCYAAVSSYIYHYRKNGPFLVADPEFPRRRVG